MCGVCSINETSERRTQIFVEKLKEPNYLVDTE
jgi:hypothetical protein